MSHFTSSHDTSIYYDDQGDGSPVVLLHGFVGDSNVDWVRSGILDRLLDEGFRVILFDARGHGLSGKPHDLASYEGDTLPNDACALLDELGLSSCVLVGFSMGARTALRTAVIDDRVTAVVALGLGQRNLEPAEHGNNRVADAMLVDDPSTIEPAEVRRFRRMADAIGADRHALAAALAAERPDLSDFVADVKVPVLVITGADDTAGSPDVLAAALPDARAITTAGDHAGVKDQAAAQEALVAFVSEHA
jgi:pimeloyl-ACP methyl ester carboxylesterase